MFLRYTQVVSARVFEIQYEMLNVLGVEINMSPRRNENESFDLRVHIAIYELKYITLVF